MRGFQITVLAAALRYTGFQLQRPRKQRKRKQSQQGQSRARSPQKQSTQPMRALK
jgi:hypothetical protein